MAFDTSGVSYGEDGKWFSSEERERLADDLNYLGTFNLFR